MVSIIKEFFNINPEEAEIETSQGTNEANQRIVVELNKNTAYKLGDTFTYKRPFGFMLNDVAIKGLKTWKSMYIKVLELLKQQDADKFNALATHPDFETNQGNRIFSSSAEDLRVAHELHEGFYVEVNYSAQHICDRIKELLNYFGIPTDDFKIYLREDRNSTETSNV